jgi:hypothetical protein
MKTKTTQSVCTTVAILLMILAGCSQPILHNRPSEESCIDYLSGQRIMVESGRFLATYWTIKKSEFKEFDIVSITTNSDRTKTAKVKFELNDGSKGLDVQGWIKYRVHEREGVLQMLEFTPEQFIKLGKW